ncbi:immunity 22 family protein [Flaviaesturariibacter terrae]
MTVRAAFWAGRFDTEEDLINYIEYQHDADGNASSPFDAALGGPGYDDDFLECVYTDPEDLVHEVDDFTHAGQYGDALRKRLRALGGEWNTLLMISGAKGDYNGWLFESDLAESPAPNLRYVGSFDVSVED